MNQIDPKLDFQTFLKSYTDEIRTQAPQPWFRHACNTALSQLAIQGASSDELTGAARFLRILSNLGETQPEPTRLPVKSLEDEAEMLKKISNKTT